MSLTPGDHTSNDELARGIAEIQAHLQRQDEQIAHLRRSHAESTKDRAQLNGRMATTEGMVAAVTRNVADLQETMKPMSDYIAGLMESDERRAQWRARVSNWVFGAGLFAFLSFALALLALIRHW